MPKHNGEFWIENGEIVWVDDAFTDHYMENLVDEDFDEGRIKLKLDHQDDSNAEYIDDWNYNFINLYIENANH